MGDDEPRHPWKTILETLVTGFGKSDYVAPFKREIFLNPMISFMNFEPIIGLFFLYMSHQ